MERGGGGGGGGKIEFNLIVVGVWFIWCFSISWLSSLF